MIAPARSGRAGFVARRGARRRALLAVAAYIDLNPLAAGVAETPEDSEHTSLRERLDHAQLQDASATVRDDPLDPDRRPGPRGGALAGPGQRPARETAFGRVGLLSGFTLSCYLRLVDAASRLDRDGKASLTIDAMSIFTRLGLDGSRWRATLDKLHHPRSPARLGRLRSRPTTSR